MRQRVALFDAEMYKIGPRGINFRPRGDDVMIVTPGKSGTTWMQQVVHQLRSGGDMSYRNISDVVPFIEMAHEIDLDAEHEYQPRLGIGERELITWRGFDIVPCGSLANK